MKKFKRLISAVVAVFMIFTINTTSVCAMQPAGEISALYIKAIINKIAEDYRFEVDKSKMYEAVLDYVMNRYPDLLEESIQAVTDTLDAHSEYFSASELSDFLNGVENIYIGIGVTVQKHIDGIIITEVNPKGGAFEAGLKTGDIIIEVNGKSTKDLEIDEAVSLVRGEEGTSVDIKVRRGEHEMSVSVVRKQIYVETVSYTVKDNAVGYIYISEFSSSTPKSVRHALTEIKGEKIKKIIIDVRDNPGGNLASVIDVLELFVPKGRYLTRIRYNEKRYNTEIKSEAEFSSVPNREIVILANENSASAAELFAGAMQNLKLAKVVGQTTYGKGSMQEFMGLINPPGYNLGDIKLSVAEFTLPDGGQINGVGIKPDVRVNNDIIPFDMSSLTPLKSNDRYKLGDTAEDVKAIEERLQALGYFTGDVDGNFDGFTEDATKKFQADVGLCSYGVMDYTTQQALDNMVSKLEVEDDRQFAKAYEILTKE